MKSKKCLAWARLPLVAATAFMLEGCGSPSGEPSYIGKPVSFWLKGYDIPDSGTEDPRKAQSTRTEAVLHLGTNTIPFLIDLLRNGSPEQANEAMQAFSTLGALARSAVPAMVDLYDKNDSSHQCRRCAGLFWGRFPSGRSNASRAFYLRTGKNREGHDIVDDFSTATIGIPRAVGSHQAHTRKMNLQTGFRPILSSHW